MVINCINSGFVSIKLSIPLKTEEKKLKMEKKRRVWKQGEPGLTRIQSTLYMYIHVLNMHVVQYLFSFPHPPPPPLSLIGFLWSGCECSLKPGDMYMYSISSINQKHFLCFRLRVQMWKSDQDITT